MPAYLSYQAGANNIWRNSCQKNVKFSWMFRYMISAWPFRYHLSIYETDFPIQAVGWIPADEYSATENVARIYMIRKTFLSSLKKTYCAKCQHCKSQYSSAFQRIYCYHFFILLTFFYMLIREGCLCAISFSVDYKYPDLFHYIYISGNLQEDISPDRHW